MFDSDQLASFKYRYTYVVFRRANIVQVILTSQLILQVFLENLFGSDANIFFTNFFSNFGCVQMSRIDLYKSILTKYFEDAAGEAMIGGGTEKTKRDKFEQLESSTTDSGFISSANLLVSGEVEIEEEDIVEPPIPREHHNPSESQRRDHKSTDNKQQGKVEDPGTYMRLDSGVDVGLSESFSSLNLKNPDLNDLNSGKIRDSSTGIKQQQQQRQHGQQQAPRQQLPWGLYYAQDEDGDTQLHIAIARDFKEACRILICSVPHPRLLDTPNDDGFTPLHMAVIMKQWEVVRLLVVAGAKPNCRDSEGNSPLHLCAAENDLKCLKAIADPVNMYEREALSLGYTQQQPYEPCNFDQWNHQGKSSVHVAASKGHLDILQHLVWYGADINAREGLQGYTALHYALQSSDEKMAAFLLSEKRVNPTVVTYAKKSVLQLGFPMSLNLAEILRLRGVAVPDEDDSDEECCEHDDEDDNEDDMICATSGGGGGRSALFMPSFIPASA